MSADAGIRTIAAIKVTQSPEGTQVSRLHMRLDWIGPDGAEEHVERHGPAAALLISDLHNFSRQGEDARRAYLVGFIRCHSLQRDTG